MIATKPVKKDPKAVATGFAVALGTYLGWNVTAGGARPFHKDQICNYAGGMIPFAKRSSPFFKSEDRILPLFQRGIEADLIQLRRVG